jgi:predicted double-glycine peptidase
MAVNWLSAPRGVRCEYKLVGSLERLTTPCVANLFSPKYGGHYVAVLRVTADYVLVGDPLSGTGKWSRGDFLHEWTGAAHVFTRDR